MKYNFQLSCESTVDMPYSYCAERDIKVLFYSYFVNDTAYEDDMGRSKEAFDRFYGFIADGNVPKTAQLNEQQYLDFLEPLLKKGDVLHVVFGTGMTESYHNAVLAAESLKEKYPERKIAVVDSTCSSSGYGLIVDDAADLRDQGAGFDEIVKFLETNKRNVHHQFYSTTLKYFRKSGRVSMATAFFGEILNICPIMHLNKAGKIIAYSKVIGKKRAAARTVSEMLAHARNGKNYAGKCFISHSNVLSDAEYMRDRIKETFPKIKDVKIFDIGTIIASHSGPGTVAVFFWGDERSEK